MTERAAEVESAALFLAHKSHLQESGLVDKRLKEAVHGGSKCFSFLRGDVCVRQVLDGRLERVVLLLNQLSMHIAHKLL